MTCGARSALEGVAVQSQKSPGESLIAKMSVSFTGSMTPFIVPGSAIVPICVATLPSLGSTSVAIVGVSSTSAPASSIAVSVDESFTVVLGASVEVPASSEDAVLEESLQAAAAPRRERTRPEAST